MQTRYKFKNKEGTIKKINLMNIFRLLIRHPFLFKQIGRD